MQPTGSQRDLLVLARLGEEGLIKYKTAPVALAVGTAPPTPIEVGTIDVNAYVIVKVELGQ